MKLSVVVPAFNEEKLIGRCLERIHEALAVFHRNGWGSEIVVCNNNSTDRTGTMAEEHGAKVVFEPVNQISRARNTGAGAASGDWFLFIDADSEPTAELFEELRVVLESGCHVGGGATVRLEHETRWIQFLVWFWNRLSRLTRWAPGSFIFCRADVFRELGGFSHELFVTEEIEFSKRMKAYARRHGLKLAILHKHPQLTSARKADLYTLKEYRRFLLGVLFNRGRAFQDRSACAPWYDGRR